MTLTIDNLIDLGKVTLQSFEKEKFTTTFKYQDYILCNKLYAGKDVRSDTGKMLTHSITLGTTGNAAHTGIFEARDPNITNIQEEIQVPWVHAESSFSYGLQEVMAQGGAKAIVSLIKIRRANMMNELADELEEAGWQTPLTSSDKKNPMGIFYWLTQNFNWVSTAGNGTAGTEDGFFGGNPDYRDDNTVSGGAGGISSATFPRWRNWYAGYTAYDDTLLAKLARAFRMTNFKSPSTVKDLMSPGMANFSLYTNDKVLGELETLALKSDDAVGYDLGKYAGRTAFKRIPLDYCPIFDTASSMQWGTDPIAGINWDLIEPVCLTGDKFRVGNPVPHERQHNVVTVHIDVSYNYICYDRRRVGFLVSKH